MQVQIRSTTLHGNKSYFKSFPFILFVESFPMGPEEMFWKLLVIVCCILTDVTSSGSRQQLLPEVVEPKQQKLESIIHKFVACMACQKQCIEGIVPSIFHLTNHFRFPQIIWSWKVFRLIICVCLTNFSIWSHCYITYLGVLYCACTSLKKVWRYNKDLFFTHSLHNYDLTKDFHIGFVH